LDLLLGYLDLFEARCDLLKRQHSALVTFRDQRAQLLKLHDWSLVTQQDDCLIAHSPRAPPRCGIEPNLSAGLPLNSPIATGE
jgi:hypothetical protein